MQSHTWYFRPSRLGLRKAEAARLAKKLNDAANAGRLVACLTIDGRLAVDGELIRELRARREMRPPEVTFQRGAGARLSRDERTGAGRSGGRRFAGLVIPEPKAGIHNPTVEHLGRAVPGQP